MALTRCPQCGRVADPPSCFACGYEWSTESAPAPSPAQVTRAGTGAQTPAGVPEAWSVPAVGSAPLKTPEPIAELAPEPQAAPASPPARNVVPISDSLDELGDIFGHAPDGSPGVVAFSDVPLPEIEDMDDDLDASISELESELAAAAVPMDDARPLPMDEEDPFVALENAFGDPPDRSPSGSVPLPEFNPEGAADAAFGLAPDDALPVVQAMPEAGSAPLEGGLPTDLFAEVDDTLAPVPTGPPPGVSAPPVVFAMPEPNDGLELDGLDIDALDLLEEESAPPLLEPEALPSAVSAPAPAALGPLPGLDPQSADELSTYKERLETFAESFEVEGRIGEAAFLYELKAFLDTLK